MENTIEINGATYQRVRVASEDSLIRTVNAGVHVGHIESVSDDGTVVTLAAGSVRVWRWRGARTLTELAAHGCDSASESNYTRVSEPSATQYRVIGACEIHGVTDEASRRIRAAGWAE